MLTTAEILNKLCFALDKLLNCNLIVTAFTKLLSCDMTGAPSTLNQCDTVRLKNHKALT